MCAALLGCSAPGICIHSVSQLVMDTYELRRVVEEPAVAFCRVTRHSGNHPFQRDDSRQIQGLLGGPLDNSTNSTKHHGCLAPERSLEQYHGSGHLCTFSAGPKKPSKRAKRACGSFGCVPCMLTQRTRGLRHRARVSSDFVTVPERRVREFSGDHVTSWRRQHRTTRKMPPVVKYLSFQSVFLNLCHPTAQLAC